MQNALKKLGIRPAKRLPIGVLLSETFNGSLYGMGEEQMERVKALRDIVTEYEASRRAPVRQITGSGDAALALLPELRDLGHEEVWVLYLNAANAVLGKDQIHKGALSETTFSCRCIVARALSSNAAGIILYHNHPSGNPSPSASDVKRTEELRDACRTIGLNLVDHVIISKSSWYSFADERITKVDK